MTNMDKSDIATSVLRHVSLHHQQDSYVSSFVPDDILIIR